MTNNSVKILAFAGSLRENSFNKQLVKIAAVGAETAGASVTFIHLKDYPLPFMDEDLEAEQGIPENAKVLKSLLKSHHGFLIASPEYNGSFSGVLKNAIDWCSRQEEGESVLECFKNKHTAIMSASPGALGGIRGLPMLRNVLSGIGCHVLPTQIAIGKAGEAFNSDHLLNRPQQQANVEKLGKELVEIIAKLQA
ncbi:MAG: NAD(P)H-dependent oxidoreductase [Pseudomonadota bacterium]